ncbi:hypothetical protein H5410_043291 [Solanum commersonii]|uniref:Uncharacterized protein n=1 Tax=Solanum commersonii TaxID=4109 RepID=A0A9J5XX53_SOLCO|nr:hypothetical protein H5410_043291 [Solanum commersonii]
MVVKQMTRKRSLWLLVYRGLIMSSSSISIGLDKRTNLLCTGRVFLVDLARSITSRVRCTDRVTRIGAFTDGLERVSRLSSQPHRRWGVSDENQRRGRSISSSPLAPLPSSPPFQVKQQHEPAARRATGEEQQQRQQRVQQLQRGQQSLTASASFPSFSDETSEQPAASISENQQLARQQLQQLQQTAAASTENLSPLPYETFVSLRTRLTMDFEVKFKTHEEFA